MTETIRKNLNDHAWARWSAMLLSALMMLFAHMFVDVISPLKELIQVQRGWTSDVFGTYAGSEYLNKLLQRRDHIHEHMGKEHHKCDKQHRTPARPRRTHYLFPHFLRPRHYGYGRYAESRRL